MAYAGFIPPTSRAANEITRIRTTDSISTRFTEPSTPPAPVNQATDPDDTAIGEYRVGDFRAYCSKNYLAFGAEIFLSFGVTAPGQPVNLRVRNFVAGWHEMPRILTRQEVPELP